MAIRLEKGQNSRLDMNIFHVGLGWDVNDDNSGHDFDLDVSAFLVGTNGKILSDDYLVFYNSEKRLKVHISGTNKGELIKPLTIVPSTEWSDNDDMRQQSRPVDPDISVIGSIDDEDGKTSEDGDDETMDIDLSRVRSEINEIVICVSIHKYAERRQNFGQVGRAYVRLYKPGQAEGEGDYIYELNEDFSTSTSVEFCRFYRRNGEWKIQALGIGHKGGLQELLDKYNN